MLALATVIPLTGWASERFGTRRLWMGSLLMFMAGSALCGLAWSAPSLIAFRVLQGLGGGMIMPVGMTILAQAAGPARMGRVMSVVGVPMVLGPVLGPALGGLLVDHAGWRWIFFVNLPVGVVALAMSLRRLPADAPRPGERLDVRGLALLSPGLAALVFGLSETASAGGLGSPKAWGGLLGGLVLISAFVLHALRRRLQPLIDLRLFRTRGFSAAAATTFLLGTAVFGAMILLPLYFQVVRGHGALGAGLLVAPQGLGAAAAMPIAGRLTDRIGARWVVLAGVCAALLGTAPLTALGPHTPLPWLALTLVVRGVGIGGAMMPAMAAAYATLSRDAVPRATSALNIVQRVGGSVGTAVLAVILQSRIQAAIPGAAGAGGGIEGLPSGVRTQVAGKLARAFSETFWWALGLTALALLPAALLARRAPTPLPEPADPAREEALLGA
jgi:EmrB/QacA subfamily drug resistance transporter